MLQVPKSLDYVPSPTTYSFELKKGSTHVAPLGALLALFLLNRGEVEGIMRLKSRLKMTNFYPFSSPISDKHWPRSE
jgi:hypothetical protein